MHIFLPEERTVSVSCVQASETVGSVMAPVAIDNLASLSPSIILSISIFLLIVVTVIIALGLCACCAAKKTPGIGNLDPTDDGVHVQVVYRSPYFCEECARRYCDTLFPADENPYVSIWWFENKKDLVNPLAADYDRRMHYFDHGVNPVDTRGIEKVLQRIKSGDKEQIRQTIIEHKTLYEASKMASSRKWPLPVASSSEKPPQSPIPVSSPSPSPKTNASPSTKYENASKKPGAATCAVSTRKGPSQMQQQMMVSRGGAMAASMASDGQMRAAAANPAYGTLYDAKSAVFNKPGGGAGARY